MSARAVIVFFVALFWLTPIGLATAGWVELDSEGSRTLFSEGKIKDSAEDEGTWSVFDTTSGELMMVDDELAIYTRAEIDGYCEAIMSATEEALAQMSPQERELLDQLMGVEAPPIHVTVRHLGEGGEIAGYPTEHYRVLVNDIPYQELWIATDAPVLQEIDIAGLQSYQKKMSSCLEEATPWALGPAPEASPEYEELLRKGWVMRSVQYDGAGEIVMLKEVVGLVQESIAAAEFDEPAGYRQLSVRQFMESRD